MQGLTLGRTSMVLNILMISFLISQTYLAVVGFKLRSDLIACALAMALCMLLTWPSDV